MKGLEGALLNGSLGRAVTRVIGKPGSLRLRLARDTAGVMAIRALSMGLCSAGRWSGTLIEGLKACVRYARELVRSEEIHVEAP